MKSYQNYHDILYRLKKYIEILYTVRSLYVYYKQMSKYMYYKWQRRTICILYITLRRDSFMHI